MKNIILLKRYKRNLLYLCLLLLLLVIIWKRNHIFRTLTQEEDIPFPILGPSYSSIHGKNASIRVYHWNAKIRIEHAPYKVMFNLKGGHFNNASVGHGQCFFQQEIDDQKMIVVSNSIHYKDSKSHVAIYGGEKPAPQELEARWMEVANTLQINLNHPQIARVVVLAEVQKTVTRLRQLDLTNSEKLIIQYVNTSITVGNQIEHATRCYRGKIVSIAHMDNLFGDGWENLDPEYMRSHKIMYALTRHTSKRGCYSTIVKASCNKYDYIGSHDTFVFHAKELITEEALDVLGNSKPSNFGIENLLIYAFRNKLKYHVLNPCPILKVHHEHCIPIHDDKKRIDGGHPIGTAPFTNKLTI